jgi:hypothetical protein
VQGAKPLSTVVPTAKKGTALMLPSWINQQKTDKTPRYLKQNNFSAYLSCLGNIALLYFLKTSYFYYN